MMVLASAPRMESTLTQFLRPRVKGRMVRSVVLLSMGTFPSVRKIFVFPGAVDPHVTFGAGTAAVTDHLKRSFIRVEQRGTGQHFKELFIEDIQMDLSGTHHPVGHGVCLEVHTTVFVAARLPFQGEMIVELPVDDGGYQRSGSNAVAEEIR